MACGRGGRERASIEHPLLARSGSAPSERTADSRRIMAALVLEEDLFDLSRQRCVVDGSLAGSACSHWS